ncbi:hypothetical protein LZ31DRAFT_79624 [Colletotrichum somersetense]|nr:hypothetical protein LZ31DRAFT_79624 [Colletotrichum somersetense]
MLRRPATTLAITAEDIAAYEDRRAREDMLRERQVLVQAQQAQHQAALAAQQHRILQQQSQPQHPFSSPQPLQQPQQQQQRHAQAQFQQMQRLQQQQQQLDDESMVTAEGDDGDESLDEYEMLRRQQEMMRGLWEVFVCPVSLEAMLDNTGAKGVGGFPRPPPLFLPDTSLKQKQ